MVVLRSGRELKTDGSASASSSSSSIAFKRPKAPRSRWTRIKNNRADHPAMPYVTEALKFCNQNSDHKYKLAEPGCIKPVCLGNYSLFHVGFEANNTSIPHAPNDMFFAELTTPSITEILSVNLCVSLGPVNSISGDIVNGCYYSRDYNSIHHPKGGGFVRGGNKIYKKLEDICCIKLSNEEMLEQVSENHEPGKDHKYLLEQVDDATPHATEAMKFHCLKTRRSYELVEPGCSTCVILPTCLLFHVNFTAKETDVDGSPVLFFAELTSSGNVLSCKSCAHLYPADLSLGDETGDKTNGCYYCRKYNKVRHPKRGGFVRGGDSLYKTFP